MSASSVDALRYLSVCSGIEAATVAWHPLGWEAAAYSEIEKFPRAVLQHHYPDTPLHGDFTTIKGDEYGTIDLLCGGTPCQAFSLAGNRKGLDDERGNLALEFCLLAERCGARWIVWENVPGVLSSNEGQDFASFLGALSELGYGWSYRVLDLQYFGIPQRRKRVVLVAYPGDWRNACAVLFEPESLQGHSAPSREKGQEIAGTLEARAATGSYDPGAHGAASNHLIAHTLTSSHGASEDGSGRGTPIIPVAACLTAKGNRQDFDLEPFVAAPVSINAKQDPVSGEVVGTLDTFANNHAVAFAENSRAEVRLEGGDGTIAGALTTGGGKPGQGAPSITDGHAVRRLTPIECERLMGFADNYTRIPYRGKSADRCPDGPRYKAIGNSWGVPVFNWLGRRIDVMEKIIREKAA